MSESYLTAEGVARVVVVFAALIGAHNTAVFFSKEKLKEKEEVLLKNVNDVEGFFKGMRRVSFKRSAYSFLGYAIVLGSYFYGCY